MSCKAYKWGRERCEWFAQEIARRGTGGRDAVCAEHDVTPHQMDMAFRKLGMPTPMSYERVGADCRVSPDTEPPAGAPIADLDFDDDETRAQATRIGPVPVAEPVESPVTAVAPTPAAVPDTDRPAADRAYVDVPPVPLSPVVLDRGELERALLVPDVHWPFADRRAWDVMIATGRKLRPHTIVTLGDFQDGFCISEHDRDPRRLTQLESELAFGRAALDELQGLGAQRHIFIEGNHCFRLQRYLMRHAPALLDSVSIAGLLGLAQRGWHHVRYMDHIRIGSLYATHDCGHAGVYAVQHTGAAFESNVVFGHTHRLSVNYTGSVLGERHVAASLGWLGDASEAKYLPEAKKRAWQLGFGIARFEPNGHVHLQAIPIVDYRACIDGALVVA